MVEISRIFDLESVLFKIVSSCQSLCNNLFVSSLFTTFWVRGNVSISLSSADLPHSPFFLDGGAKPTILHLQPLPY